MIPPARRTPARQALALSLVSALAVGNGPSAMAQGGASAARDGWLVGPLVGLPGSGSDYELQYVTLGLGATRLVPNRPGLAFAIGTIPRAIPEGIFPIAARMGPSIPLALGPDAFLIPSVGLTGAGGVASGGGFGAAGGYYWGAAAVAGRGSVGIHVGVTWHRPAGADDLTLWLAEVGIMHMPLPRRSR